MIIGATLLLALVAAGLGTLLRWIVGRLGGPEWLAFWLGLTLALFVMASGPIRIG
jgi:hypothetical protein